MSCCCSDTSHPKGIARLLVRIGFGLTLVFMGIAYYQDPQFAEAVGRGLGGIESVGMIWGYILPALLIIGGVLLTLGLFMNVAAWTAGIALVSVPVILMMKSVFGIPVEDMKGLALPEWLLVIVYMYAVKGGSCHWMGSDCACCTDDKPPVVSKSAPSKPVVAMPKAPAKKAAPRKR